MLFRSQLQQAVQQEHFEEAAKLRDEIRSLEANGVGGGDNA